MGEWQPIETAPKDGTEIQARGYNWGDRTRGRHRVLAKWWGNEWHDADDEDTVLKYLTEWRPNSSDRGQQ